MRKLVIASAALVLSGCATTPRALVPAHWSSARLPLSPIDRKADRMLRQIARPLALPQ